MDQSRDVEAEGEDHGGDHGVLVHHDSTSLRRRYKAIDGTRTTAILSWKDLSVTVNNNRYILQDLSGCAEPGQLVAIMGPSGSGKTSLLDALAGRTARAATVTGEILVNGNKAELSYGNCAYVDQNPTLLGTLTVFETLYFSASFRFRKGISRTETKQIVMSAIEDVGLVGSMNTIIGTWFKRGISGGEKRRVSIAIALLTSPTLIFLDEPTTGLDSAASFHVIQTLKGLAQSGDRTILCCVHQPSSEVFELFDDLCLISDARQVYYGPLPEAEQFFEGCGYPCPQLRSASDHYLHSINSDFDIVKRRRVSDAPMRTTAKEAAEKLTQAYSTSDQKRSLDARLESLSQFDGEYFQDSGSHAGFLKQTAYLTIRSGINMYRDVGYYWLRYALYFVIAMALGTIYMHVGKNYSSIQARSSFFAYTVCFLDFMAIAGFPSFVEDMKVFYTERMSGYYGVGAYVLANTLSSVPYIFGLGFLVSVIVYPLVGDFHGGFSHILYFFLDIFATFLVSEALMMGVTSLVPQYLLGINLGAVIQGVFIALGGFLRLRKDLPNAVWKYPVHYMSFITYALSGMLENEFRGKKVFGNLNPNDPPLTGRFILHDWFSIEIGRGRWWNLAIVYMIFIIFRIIFWSLLEAREVFFPKIGSVIYNSTSNLRAQIKLSRTSRNPTSSQEI